MARNNNAASASLRSTGGVTSIQEILNGDLRSETFRLRAENVLIDKDLVRNVMGMAPQDQARFLDKVDQVQQSRRLSQNPRFTDSRKGIPYFRLAKCEMYLRPRERMQRDPAASDFSRALHGTGKTRYNAGGVRRSD